MPVEMLALVALLPILTALVLMVGFRWPATRAMPVAFTIALVLAVTIWRTPVNWILAASANGLVIALAVNALNLVLDPLLIFGPGPFPRLELVGAAWASTVAYALGAAIMVVRFRRLTGVRWVDLLVPRPSDLRR